jgi:hypothetical protein
MLIKDVLALLTEYNTSKTNTTLAGQGGEKATGKNYDNIIVGKAKPYKGNEYETKYARVFPALAEIVKKVKTQSLKGDIMVTGPALQELNQLLKAYKPKPTPEGDFSLPFGDNVRMKYKSNTVFVGYHDPDKLTGNAPAPTAEPAPAADITK